RVAAIESAEDDRAERAQGGGQGQERGGAGRQVARRSRGYLSMATLLLAEIANGHLGDITARALTAALQLGAPVEVLVSGRNVAEAAAAAAKLAGGAKVRVADDALDEDR